MLQAHEQWRYNMIGRGFNWELADPLHFERATRFIRPDDVREAVFVSAQLSRHAAHLNDIASLGVESIDVHNVGLNQTEFIEAFGREVLPKVRSPH